MRALQRWTRWQVERTLERGRTSRIPETGGFRYLSEAMAFCNDCTEAKLWVNDYAPYSVQYVVTQQFEPAWDYIPGRVPELQRVPHYILYWRHSAASVSRTGVWDTDGNRITALVDELNLLFYREPYCLKHQVVELADGLEVPWANWDDPVDGSHPLWRLEQVPAGIRAVLKGQWLKPTPIPEPIVHQSAAGLGERSMLL